MDGSVIVADVGGTHVRMALSDSSLTLRGKLDRPTAHERGPDSVIEQIVSMARESAAQAAADWGRVRLLVLGTPGPLDARSGVVFDPPNMPGWHDVPLKALLEEQLGMTVKVVNDANAAAMGEFHFGAGRGQRDLVYITVSTGIGGGVVAGGRLLEGTRGTAGEIGHISIDRHGPLCKCGNVGCLEVLASGTAIARFFQARLAAGEPSLAREWLRGEPTAADVARAAARGDAVALEVFTEAAECLGLGVVNCLHLFNPDVVAIGGGVSQAGALLFDPVRRVVDRYALEIPRRSARIVAAQLGEDVGLVGAAAVAFQERNAATAA